MITATKWMLIDAIIGGCIPDRHRCEELSLCGFMKPTENPDEEKWEWNRAMLECVDDDQLEAIYARYGTHRSQS